MERNYYASGGYVPHGGGNSAGSDMVSSGRRAGQLRTLSSDALPAPQQHSGYSGGGSGYHSGGMTDISPSRQPVYGRRASPGAVPSGTGMEMTPPPGYGAGYASGAPRPAPRPSGIPGSSGIPATSGMPRPVASGSSAMPAQRPAAMPSNQPQQQQYGMPAQRPAAMPSGQPQQQQQYGMPAQRPAAMPSNQPQQQQYGMPAQRPAAMPSGQPQQQQQYGMPAQRPAAMPSSQPQQQQYARPPGMSSGTPPGSGGSGYGRPAPLPASSAQAGRPAPYPASNSQPAGRPMPAAMPSGAGAARPSGGYAQQSPSGYAQQPSSGYSASASAAPAAAAAPVNKLAGLQRLKEAANARLANRAPSAGRERPDGSGYVPSTITNPQPARHIPGAGPRPGSGPTSAAPAPMPRPSRSNPPPAQDSGGYSSSGYGGRPSWNDDNGVAAAAPAPAPRNAALASLAARRQQVAAPAPAPAPSYSSQQAAPSRPPPQQQQQRAPPPPQPAPRSMPAAYSGGATNFGAGSIPPGADEASGPMVECPSCGRSFNQKAYAKHAKVCEKVFVNKRKPVNMAAKRVGGTEAAKYFDMRKGVPKSEAGGGAGAGGRGGAAPTAYRALENKPVPAQKQPKWKAQSLQLRAAMAANRKIAEAKANGIDIRNVDFGSVPQVEDDRTPCPHCGRKFAALVAERHIPKCTSIQAKPKMLAAGSGGKGPHSRR